MLHTSTGSRDQVMPGARMVTTVATMLIAPSVIEMAKITIVTQ